MGTRTAQFDSACRMEVHVRTFRVRRPNGADTLVDEIQEFVDVSPRRNGTDHIPGPKRLALRTGEPIYRVDELTLQNARDGEVLRIIEEVSPLTP
jgi:hypothetical protein